MERQKLKTWKKDEQYVRTMELKFQQNKKIKMEDKSVKKATERYDVKKRESIRKKMIGSYKK